MSDHLIPHIHLEAAVTHFPQSKFRASDITYDGYGVPGKERQVCLGEVDKYEERNLPVMLVLWLADHVNFLAFVHKPYCFLNVRNLRHKKFAYLCNTGSQR